MPADDVCDGRPEAPGRPTATVGGQIGGPVDREARRPQVAGKPFRFRPAHRLLDRRDFDRVLRGGRRRSLPELVVVTSAPGERGRRRDPFESDAPIRSRLGITVGRKAGSSVERNRFKRRVREWFRRQRATLEPPVDIVVIARRPAVDLSFEELSRRLARLLASSISQPTGINQEKRKA